MIAAVVSCALLALADPATVAVEPLAFDPAAWKAKASVEVRVQEKGQEVVYKGIPLRTILVEHRAVNPPGQSKKMGELRALSDAVLVVRGSDDYQASVSAAAVAMDEGGQRYLLATERDGKPLGEGQGPVKLIIPGDPQHVRWVHAIDGIDLVRMPARAKVKAPKSPAGLGR